LGVAMFSVFYLMAYLGFFPNSFSVLPESLDSIIKSLV
jgi:hypothetical protein